MAPAGVQLTLPIPQGAEHILSDDALAFLAVLHRCFNKKRLELLDNRKKVQAELDKVSSFDVDFGVGIQREST